MEGKIHTAHLHFNKFNPVTKRQERAKGDRPPWGSNPRPQG